jgi:hypothetical protein
MKVFKIEIMVIDFDQLGEEGLRQELENARFPNDCINLSVQNIESRDIDFSDDHPLNKRDSRHNEYLRLFKE